MKSLFKTNNQKPLADKIRPTNIDEIFGQDHLFAPNSVIRKMIDAKLLQNIILWGPAGSGKTTIARIIASNLKCHVEFLSAVTSNTSDLKQTFANAKNRKLENINTILIVDEIHHFNRTIQDIFLPYLEDGTITLIGATTENPSFELNGALLSRSTILTLKCLESDALNKIVLRAEEIYQKKLPLDDADREKLYEMAAGDGRYLLGICERLFELDHNQDSCDILASITARAAIYDKSGDAHYSLISAVHKSIRGSDVDATLYWLSRMIESGENPHYIIRRLVRIANEDIGLSDPNALVQALSAKDAYDFLGSPEGDLSIMQAGAYLASAPKSNAIYLAAKSAKADAKRFNNESPPAIILNAPTKLMKEQGYGKGYIYDHDTKEAFSGQNYFPEKMGRKQYYQPQARGYEKEIIKRLDYWNKLRDQKNDL
jgi:putative ATPase